jgi:transposase InsO family protein
MADDVYLKHDQAAQFNLNYFAYGIKEIIISAYAPNMNAIAECFVGSVRREALDYYLLISETQIMRILQGFIDYYNSKCPHHGIDQQVPIGYNPQIWEDYLRYLFLVGNVIIIFGGQRDG